MRLFPASTTPCQLDIIKCVPERRQRHAPFLEAVASLTQVILYRNSPRSYCRQTSCYLYSAPVTLPYPTSVLHSIAKIHVVCLEATKALITREEASTLLTLKKAQFHNPLCITHISPQSPRHTKSLRLFMSVYYAAGTQGGTQH